MHLIDCTTKKLASMRNLFARKHVVHEAATHFVNAFHQDLLKDAKTLKGARWLRWKVVPDRPATNFSHF